MKFKIFIAAFLLSITFLSSAFASGFMEVANVTKIHGKAFIDKEEIKVGAEVAEGMIINLPASKDFIEIKFQNGHVVRLTGANVKVETLNPKNTLFTLIKGTIFSAIKPLTQNETFHVKTKRVAFGVRGTRFYIDESKKATYLCVCEGSVIAKSSKGEVEVKKDEDLTLTSKKSKLKVVKASQMMIDMGNTTFKDMGVIE